MKEKNSFQELIDSFVDLKTNPLEFMQKTTFKRSELGLDARVANHWATKGLFSREYEIGSWLIFDLPESFWVKIMMKMRELNISLETIKKIKQSFFEENIRLNSDKDKNHLIKLLKKSQNVNLDFINKISDEEIWNLISKKELNPFELMIQSILLDRNSYLILIDNKGDSILITEEQLHFESNPEYQQEIYRITTKSHIRISMNEILGELVTSLGEIICSQKIPILTKNEATIIDFIRKDNISKIEIKYSKDSKPDIIEITSINSINEKARLKDLIISRGYQNITIKTQKGQIAYCENIVKYKLDNEELESI